jgi:hypothetical protein
VSAAWVQLPLRAGESVGEVSQQRSDRRVGHMVQDRAIEPGSQAAERRPVDARQRQPRRLLPRQRQHDVTVQHTGNRSAMAPVTCLAMLPLSCC